MVPLDANEDEIDLRQLWSTFWEGRWWVFLVVVLSMGIAIAYALTTVSMYKSEVVVMPAQSSESGGRLAALSSQFGGLASLAGVNLPTGGGGGVTEEALAVLQSRRFLMRFIKSRDLLPVLYSSQWDMAKKEWRPLNKTWLSIIRSKFTPDVHASNEPTLVDGATYFAKDVLAVTSDKKTGIITITVSWDSPDPTAQWANALVSKLNKDFKIQSKRELSKAIEFLTKQVKTTSLVDAQAVIFKLIEDQTKAKMFADIREDYVFKVIDPAVVPSKPYKPRRTLIVALAAILGLIVGFIALMARQAFSSEQRGYKLNEKKRVIKP